MSRPTVAVVGASGFVGSTFVDRLVREDGASVVPLIHSTGNAARPARLGLDLRIVDLLSPASLRQALEGCTHVVNCSRGSSAVMIQGLKHLLDHCRTAGVQRFVHLSSVAVYGDVPPGALLEHAETRAAPGTYGATKLRQDEMVKAAAAGGLPAVVLCPPNISGPYSPFLIDIVQTLRAGQFGLVDDGSLPCELVDVENLVHAMRLALAPDVRAGGERLFVTDCAPTTWRDVVDALCDLAEPPTVTQLDEAAAARLAAPRPAPTASIRRTVLHLLSSDVRETLRKDPLLARMELTAKSAVRSMPAGMLKRAMRVSQGDGGRRPVRAVSRGPAVSPRLVQQQLRRVRYDGTRIRDTIGYGPVVSFDESMQAFRRWYQEVVGWNTDEWPLLRRLYAS